MTYSIVAFDPANGDLGVAVQSKFPNAGVSIPFARAGVGAIASQAYLNPGYGHRGLVLLENGATPQQALEFLTERIRSDDLIDLEVLGDIRVKHRKWRQEDAG